uniref:Uncharacterized protein n=1 Tax=Arion vulgaris TaxID=1028688 RepID=A0A0B7A8F4_9EUPU
MIQLSLLDFKHNLIWKIYKKKYYRGVGLTFSVSEKIAKTCNAVDTAGPVVKKEV